MKQYDKNRPLISIHIPKCAGTSFTAILKKWFGNNLYTHYVDEKHDRMPPKYNLKTGLLKQRYKKGLCIHGHFNRERKCGIMDYYPEVDQFITILRDPLEMSLSNYFFGKKLGQDSFRSGKPVPMENRFSSISDYLINSKSYLLLHMPYEMTLETYENILESNFVYIGVVEDLQTSVDVLADRLNFPSVKIDHLNISRRDEDIPETVREDFMNRHKLEYAIYDFALKNYRG